jgi:hypothetical protein
MSEHETMGACPEHFELMRSALDHIAKTARRSRTATRRLRWIEARAEGALAGRPFVRAEIDLPETVDSQASRNQRLRCRIKRLEAALTSIERMAEIGEPGIAQVARDAMAKNYGDTE